VSREMASPELANLVAARLPPEEFDRRVRAPMSDAEAQDIAELVEWFKRRYPTAEARLAYARRKMRQYAEGHGPATVAGGYLATAERLARAHRMSDPETLLVLLAQDPQEREIRLVEVTRSAPTTGTPVPVGFTARPDLGMPFPLEVFLVSPAEWDAVSEGRLDLPAGWIREQLIAV
jgi:hypothetical protein